MSNNLRGYNLYKKKEKRKEKFLLISLHCKVKNRPLPTIEIHSNNDLQGHRRTFAPNGILAS